MFSLSVSPVPLPSTQCRQWEGQARGQWLKWEEWSHCARIVTLTWHSLRQTWEHITVPEIRADMDPLACSALVLKSISQTGVAWSGALTNIWHGAFRGGGRLLWVPEVGDTQAKGCLLPCPPLMSSSDEGGTLIGTLTIERPHMLLEPRVSSKTESWTHPVSNLSESHIKSVCHHHAGGPISRDPVKELH